MPPPQLHRIVVVVGATSAIAAAAWPAEAQTPPTTPTLVAALPCFSPSSGSKLTGEGWTPGGKVHLSGTYGSGEPALDHDLTADDAGRITLLSRVPDDDLSTSNVTVTAEDMTRAAAGIPVDQRQATTSFKFTWSGAFYRPWNTDGPAIGHPGRVHILEASGYLTGNLTKVLYAHYIRLIRGRLYVETVRVGRLSGPCMGVKVRFREFNFRPVPRGTYQVSFDTNPYSDETNVDSAGYSRVKVRTRIK